ncbi:MAG: hypothetical protein ACRDY7_06155, partial [Acidimicrobiia bacterium]
VVVCAGRDPAVGRAAAAVGDDQITAALRSELDAGSSTRDAAAAVAARLGVSRRRVYTLAVSAFSSQPSAE